MYTYNTLEKEGTANYGAGDRVLNSDGSPRQSNWEAGTWLRKQEVVTDKFKDQFDEFYDDLGINFLRYDVDTYAPPHLAGGNHVDADAGSKCGTLRGAIAERRKWMYECKQFINGDKAYSYGEGTRVSHNSDWEVLYAGPLDGTHSWVNTNSKLEEANPNYPQERSISNWPMMVEHTWKAVHPYFQHTNNNPNRCLTIHDAHLQDEGVNTLFPYSRAVLDRLRSFAFLYGRTGAIAHVSKFETFMPLAEVIKEYYIVNAMCRLAGSERGKETTVLYHDDVHGFEDETTKFHREQEIGFIKTRVRIQIGEVTIWVNRSDTDWAIDIYDVIIPPDGFLCIGKGKVFGSVKSDLFLKGVRADIAFSPGEYILIDGRGTQVSFLGIKSTEGRMALAHYKKGFMLKELTDGTIKKLGE